MRSPCAYTLLRAGTLARLPLRSSYPLAARIRGYSTPAVHADAVPLFINGHRQQSDPPFTFSITNPASQRIVGHASAASAADCASAVAAAHASFPAWERTPPPARRDVFLRAADILVQDAWRAKVMDAMAAEIDAAPFWAEFNWRGAVDALRATAGLVTELAGRAYPSACVPGAQVFEQKRAMGVIFTIAPWNAPIILSVRALAIPLLCGNGVVFKPSDNTPRSQAIVADALNEAGLPAGVLNYVPIAKDDAPVRCAEIIANPAVKKITFTGSDRVGRALASEAAKHLKSCVLELGGKSPAVVLEDADVDHAARTIVFGALANSGQICMSTERVIAVRAVAPALRAALAALLASDLPPLGALFSAGAAERLVGMIGEARARGAEVLVGDGARDGARVRPHLLAGVQPGTALWEKEQFGPVISVMEVEDADAAIAAANATRYSLTAAVFTRDVNAALDASARIRAGCISVNGPTFHAEPSNTEFGLSGASGYGRFDVDAFTDRRTVVVHPRAVPYPFFD